MRCFIHPLKDAIGICRSCSRFLCSDCMVEIGRGLACKDSCEQDVKDINEVIHKGKLICKNSKSSCYVHAGFYSLIGLVFICYPLFIGPPLFEFMLPIGGVFILFAILQFIMEKKPIIYKVSIK